MLAAVERWLMTSLGKLEKQSKKQLRKIPKFISSPKKSLKFVANKKKKVSQQPTVQDQKPIFFHSTKQLQSSSLSVDSQILLHALEIRSKQRAFIDLCYKHQEFFEASLGIDSYILSMCWIYFQRVGFRQHEYTSDRLFQGLYIAVATEEDSPQGRDEIIAYSIGVSLENLDQDYVPVKKKCTFLDHDAWTAELEMFFRKTFGQFWKLLQFQTLVSEIDCSLVMQNMEDECEFMAKPRTDATLSNFHAFE